MENLDCLSCGCGNFASTKYSTLLKAVLWKKQNPASNPFTHSAAKKVRNQERKSEFLRSDEKISKFVCEIIHDTQNLSEKSMRVRLSRWAPSKNRTSWLQKPGGFSFSLNYFLIRLVILLLWNTYHQVNIDKHHRSHCFRIPFLR